MSQVIPPLLPIFDHVAIYVNVTNNFPDLRRMSQWDPGHTSHTVFVEFPLSLRDQLFSAEDTRLENDSDMHVV